MKQTDAAEDAELSDFQRELVQLSAALNGDHAKGSIFPETLVEGMTVAQGASYTQDALATFLQEADRCRKNGADGCHIVALPAAGYEEKKEKKKKPSWYSGWVACLACNHA